MHAPQQAGEYSCIDDEHGESINSKLTDSSASSTSDHDESIQIQDKKINPQKRSAESSTVEESTSTKISPDRKKLKKNSAAEINSAGTKKINFSNKKKKSKQVFSNRWLNVNNFKGWLQKHPSKQENGDEMGYCKVRDKKLTAHKSALNRHLKSQKHREKWNEPASNQKMIETPMIKLEKSVRRAEIKLTGLLATNNLAFRIMDVLSPLCYDIFPDSKIAKQLAVRRTKSTALMKNALGEEFKNEIFNTLKTPGCFFSVIMDKLTDQSATKQCGFAVIYYDIEQLKVKTRFFDMVAMAYSKAQDLCDCLKLVLDQRKIPLNNLVGFSSDTMNVMFGANHSVVSLLLECLPNVVCIKCTCHSSNLAVCAACLKLPRSVEDLVRNIGAHFSRSALRREDLKEFQEFVETGIYRILVVSITRWLSLKDCVDRILKQFAALLAYFSSTLLQDP